MPIFSPPRIIVAGPPGSGKSTQCKFISECFGVVHISVEDVVAEAMSLHAEDEALADGKESQMPITNDTFASLISERIKGESASKHGWLLDGFPRNASELEIFQSLDVSCDAFVFLDVESHVLVKRASDRARDLNDNTYNTPDANLDSVDQNNMDEMKVADKLDEYFGDIPEVLNYFRDKLVHINGNREIKFIKDEILSLLKRTAKKSVIFVVGGTGTGKRTHCDMVATSESFAHLNPKELINQEQYFDSDISNEIDRITSRGQDIPSHIIIQLLVAAMSKSEATKFIIDSFPRNEVDLECWYKEMSEECIVDFIIHLKCPSNIIYDRYLVNKESSHQAVPSISGIVKKHKIFYEESFSFLQKMKNYGRTREISTVPPIEVVNKKLSRLIKSLDLIPPYERSLCIVKPDAVGNGNVPAILSVINEHQLAIVFTRFVTMTKDVVDDFFKASSFCKSRQFKKHRDNFTSGPSLLVVVEGSDAIRRLQDLIGHESSFKSQPFTLRCQFGTDAIRNGFYCSTNEPEAVREINYWMIPNDFAASVAPECAAGKFAVEETFALIKPKFAESCYDDIIAIIEGHGFDIHAECRLSLTASLLTELYPEMKSNSDFSKAKDYLLSGPVVGLHLKRDSALKAWRHLMGFIDLKRTQYERFDSIRSKFALNSLENAVHGSFNSLVGNNELNLFFPILKKSDVSSNTTKTEKPKTAKRKKRKQQVTTSTMKPNALHSYLSQDVNPVLNDLVRNLAIQKPKDIMGYAINELIEKQKMDVHKIGTTKNKMHISSSTSALPSIPHKHHISSEKSVMDGLPEKNAPNDECVMSLEKAYAEIAKLQCTIKALSSNILDECEKKNDALSLQSPRISTNEPSRSKTLKVLSFGDFVGFGNSQKDIVEGNTMACFSAAVKNLKNEGNPLVLFTGNFLGCSSTIDSTHYSSMISLIDNLGINYGVLGNRDLEFGWKDVHNHLKFSLVTWITSNIVKPDTNQPFKNCEEKVLIDWNGVCVGLIGIVDDWTMHSSVDTGGIRILDPLDTAIRLCSDLKDAGAEVVLIMSHCVDQHVNEDLSVLPDVQVVVSGHEMGFRSWKLDKSAMGVACGGFGGISNVTIEVTPNMTPVVSWPPSYFMVSDEQQPFDVIDSIISNLREENEANHQITLGATSVELCSRKYSVRTSETVLGNLITDMMREISKSTIAVLHSGAMSPDGLISPGLISVGDILKMFPFHDYVATVSLSGHQIRQMLNNSVSRAPSADGRFLQVSGLSFEYQLCDRSDGDRCTNIKIGNKEIKLDEHYTCSLPGWLLEGHDGYKCFGETTCIEPKELCPTLIQVIYSYFDKKMLSKAKRYYGELTEDDFDPVIAEVEGRISKLEADITTSCLTNNTTICSGRSDDAIVPHRNDDDQEEEDDDDENEELGIDYGTISENVLSSKFRPN